MPTLWDLCDIDIPATVEGHSLVGAHHRKHLYCEHFEDAQAMRMVRCGRHKLIYYPAGNCAQLFDLEVDPQESNDLENDEAHATVRCDLETRLIDEFYGDDLAWVQNGRLVGMAEPEEHPTVDR